MTAVGPGLLVLRNMCKTARLKAGEQRAKELIDLIRALEDNPNA